MVQRMSIKQIAIKTARELRQKQTKSEEIFWSQVRDRHCRGYKFLRQHPIFYEYYGIERFFIADFYCCELKLVIEIDGGIHEKQEDYDAIRSEIMKIQKDIRVIRFKNKEVLNDMENLLKKMIRQM